jgi:hypothetical protein
MSCPAQHFLSRHKIQDSIFGYFAADSGGEGEIQEFQLPGVMGITAERDAHSFFARNLEQANIDVLPVGAGVDLDSRMNRGFLKKF